ncbi:succinyldiaminopimelate transaminase [Candidatus Nitrosoglobus terrae]|uniref:Succinyldiaminopimelate transaminase n=1 Tax=Candidatus Nitrosoglobus terrae TaxID=1630141 RepID=A0A1Q2SND6_9GAMM|nr:succinyldiaminopimelate transaminase [Candidatus Nitrosoglobus terrae]
MINPRFTKLQSYPFERLAQLIQGITPSASKSPITLSISELKHATLSFIIETAISHLQEGLSIYPTTRDTIAL